MVNHSGLLFMLLSKWIITGCSGQISIIMSPQNQAVLQSESVTFQCRMQQESVLDTAGYIAWEECITKGGEDCLLISNDGVIVYTHLDEDPIRGSRYSITPNPAQKQFDLTISGTTGVLLEDAGQYMCHARNDPNAQRFTELIVLNADPVCTRNTTTANEAVEGDYIRMTCTVTYEGRWAPVMAFTRNGADITAVDESSGNTVTYSYTLVAGPSNNGDVYTIRTYFNTPTDAGTDEATNRPSYENNYTFEPLSVWYSPKNITITPNKTIFSQDETISCTASANPAASYDIETKLIHSSNSSLAITWDMLGNGTYSCRAYNQYGNATADKEFMIQGNPTGLFNSLLIAVGCLAAMLVISLIAKVMMVLYFRGCLSTKAKTTTSQTNPFSQGQHPMYQEMNESQAVAPSVHTDIDNEHPEDQYLTTSPYDTVQDADQQPSSAYQDMGDRQPVDPSVYTDIHRKYPGVQSPSTSPYATVQGESPYTEVIG